MTTLIERRDEVAARRDGLRRERSAAVLQTGALPAKVDQALSTTERELEALEDALGEEVRRQRLADAQEEAARLAHARAGLRAAEAKRLDAVSRAQAGAKATAEALRDALDATAEAEKCMATIGRPRPPSINLREMERWLGGKLSLTLWTVSKRFKIGNVVLHPLPFETPESAKDWRAEAERIGAAALNPLLSPEQETDQ